MTLQEERAQEMLPVTVTDGQDSGQFRISNVQILNWGAYENLQSMAVSRSGTVLLGPSGRGKSTLLDAMSSVIMPNPQEFNQAARDDRHSKRERTVYTYARGYTDVRQDQNQVSTTTHYLRPPGIPGFPSGAAITWETGDGRSVTSFRVAWVRPDATEQGDVTRNTIYGLVHDRFDLARLKDVTPRPGAASPLTKASVEPLLDLGRGDVVDAAQAKIHARMRTSMGLGSSEESQELALTLLRRAQSSKGIGNINSLFKTLVLTEPLAPTRWETVLASYREASNLYGAFEDARRQADILQGLPVSAEKYRAAIRDATDKRRLYLAEDGSPARVDVWHATKVSDWAQRKIEDVVLARAELTEEKSKAEAAAKDADDRLDEVLRAIAAAGGDRTEAAQLRLDTAQRALEQIEELRTGLYARLSVFGLVLPTSAGDVDLTRAAVAEKVTTEKSALETANAAVLAASGRVWQLREAVKQQEEEIRGLKARKSLIPPDAERRRQRIVDALSIPAERLPYAGELLEVPVEHRRWENAIIKLLSRLTSTLLIPASEYERVRRYVHTEDMGGVLHAVPVEGSLASGPVREGSIPSLLEVADHEFAGWVTSQLTSRYNFLCVEGPDDLDQRLPDWARGAITPAAMVSGRHPGFTKDDARRPYPWIGRDPRRLLQQMDDTLESQNIELEHATTKAEEASTSQQETRRRIDGLNALNQELTWDRIDDTRAGGEVAARRRELEQASSPEVRRLSQEKETRQKAWKAAAGKVEALDKQGRSLNDEHAALCDLQDQANVLVDGTEPLTDEERHLLTKVPFAAPAEPTQAMVRASLTDARTRLREQVERHDNDRTLAEAAVVATIQAYRNLDERIARRYDQSIDALPAVEAAYHQLVEDDLPRARAAWLAKTAKDLNTALQNLLVQIKNDMREIRTGLNPINSVLRSVPFRETSTLRIDPIEIPTADQKDFTSAITRYTSNTIGIDVERDADEIEASFRRLRQHLRRLDDKSRAGESWQRRVFDAREQFNFRAIETRPDQTSSVYEGVSGMSGGEGQELLAFLMGAALRYRLGEGRDRPPRYASIILDEGFVKSDSDYTGRALGVLKALGFQLIVGSPREKATAFERYMDSVAYISRDAGDEDRARIYPMTMHQAMLLGDDTDAPEKER